MSTNVLTHYTLWQIVKLSIRQILIDFEIIVLPRTSEFHRAHNLCVQAHEMVRRFEDEADSYLMGWDKFFTPTSIEECVEYLEKCKRRMEHLELSVQMKRATLNTTADNVDAPGILHTPEFCECVKLSQAIDDIDRKVFPREQQ